MRSISHFSIIALGLSLAGCDSSSVVGKTPEEQAQIAVETVCQKEAECGDTSVECSGNGSGNLSCTGSIKPVSYEACVAEAQPEITQDFTRCMLTDAQAEAVDVCLSDYAAITCPTQADLDARIKALEEGRDPPSLGSTPASCEALDSIFDNCQSDNPDNPPRVECSSESMSGNSEGCEFQWECSGNRFEIKCTTANGTDSCECIENGLSRGTFDGPTVCQQNTDTGKNTARQACGFNL